MDFRQGPDVASLDPEASAMSDDSQLRVQTHATLQSTAGQESACPGTSGPREGRVERSMKCSSAAGWVVLAGWVRFFLVWVGGGSSVDCRWSAGASPAARKARRLDGWEGCGLWAVGGGRCYCSYPPPFALRALAGNSGAPKKNGRIAMTLGGWFVTAS